VCDLESNNSPASSYYSPYHSLILHRHHQHMNSQYLCFFHFPFSLHNWIFAKHQIVNPVTETLNGFWGQISSISRSLKPQNQKRWKVVRLGYQENRNLKKRNGKTTHLQRSGLSESTSVRASVRRSRSGLLGFQLGRSIRWAVELWPYWLQWTFPELEVLHRRTSGGRPWWPRMKSPPPKASLQARADSWTYQDGKSGWETRLQECHRVAGLNYTTVGSALQQQLFLLAEFALSRFTCLGFFSLKLSELGIEENT
jgi:hypothetical protein